MSVEEPPVLQVSARSEGPAGVARAGRGRRSGGHDAGQRPVPDRVHRVGRSGASPPNGPFSPPTAGTGRSRPSKWRRPERRTWSRSRSAGLQAQRDAAGGCSPARGPIRIGLEADTIFVGGQPQVGRKRSIRTPSKPVSGVVEALRECQGRVRARPDGPGRRHRRCGVGRGPPPPIGGGDVEHHRGVFCPGPRTPPCGGEVPRGGVRDDRGGRGPTSARAHHRPDSRPIRVGDPVVVDLGALHAGYRSDMTRTFCVGGEPEGELARIFEVVRQSQAEGDVRRGARRRRQGCRRGLPQGDRGGRVGRRVSSTAPGNGVGLDIHEAPTVSPSGHCYFGSRRCGHGRARGLPPRCRRGPHRGHPRP